MYDFKFKFKNRSMNPSTTIPISFWKQTMMIGKKFVLIVCVQHRDTTRVEKAFKLRSLSWMIHTLWLNTKLSFSSVFYWSCELMSRMLFPGISWWCEWDKRWLCLLYETLIKNVIKYSTTLQLHRKRHVTNISKNIWVNVKKK